MILLNLMIVRIDQFDITFILIILTDRFEVCCHDMSFNKIRLSDVEMGNFKGMGKSLHTLGCCN